MTSRFHLSLAGASGPGGPGGPTLAGWAHPLFVHPLPWGVCETRVSSSGSLRPGVTGTLKPCQIGKQLVLHTARGIGNGIAPCLLGYVT